MANLALFLLLLSGPLLTEADPPTTMTLALNKYWKLKPGYYLVTDKCRGLGLSLCGIHYSNILHNYCIHFERFFECFGDVHGCSEQFEYAFHDLCFRFNKSNRNEVSLRRILFLVIGAILCSHM
ncbi:uncharacterized protein LOC106875678 [Octopus bimaculoides]|uniref:Uncharacterized protein n=1 Tax=Octopus bimaculoides TaxID=37653 RepID=A0A0L8GNL3_OCTBM|nr:uncharacterized protein LOC106875678 [Octopus bimaculoides]|eukprot:XP_014779404.1 PREDICTED: uncharacterized protein LOC106875678 isoform X1 [Octopus bimaculoides]